MFSKFDLQKITLENDSIYNVSIVKWTGSGLTPTVTIQTFHKEEQIPPPELQFFPRKYEELIKIGIRNWLRESFLGSLPKRDLELLQSMVGDSTIYRLHKVPKPIKAVQSVMI